MKLMDFLKKNGSNILATTLGFCLGWGILYGAFTLGSLGYNAIHSKNKTQEPPKTETVETVKDTTPNIDADTNDFKFNANYSDGRTLIDIDLRDHMKPTMDDIIDVLVKTLGEESRPNVASVMNTASSSDLLGGLTVSYYPPLYSTFVIEGVGFDINGNEIAFTIGMDIDLRGDFDLVGIYQWEQVKG